MNAIVRSIMDGQTLFESLESTLLAQYRHLLKRDMVAVEKDAAQLRDYVDRIRMNARMRNQQLVQQGFSADETGMRRYINSLSGSQKQSVAHQWQDLETRVHRCRELNTANGRLQGRLRAVTSKLLEVLWGQMPGRSYNRFGHLDGAATPKTISDA